MIDFAALRDFVLANRIFDSEFHGLAHWRQVESNGLLLVPSTGADATVVSLFALFHDCKRKDDGSDAGHGPRCAAFAERCFEEERLGITREQFAKLHHACTFHTTEPRSGDATIDTCYDADRLDLGRVGIRPRSRTDGDRSGCRNCPQVHPEKVVDFGIGTARLALPVNDKMARLTFMSTAEMLRLKDRLTR